MNTQTTWETNGRAHDSYEELARSTQRTLPATPFPRGHVHCVFDSPRDVMQAVLTLRAAGYDDEDIHVMTGREYMEAVEQGHTLITSLTSSEDDVYLHEARRGRYFLAVRLYSYEQIEQIRRLLARHHAHLMKYVDTWTVIELVT